MLIPEAVFNELRVAHVSVPHFIRCEHVSDARAVQFLTGELDLGEAEAIILAKERRADALLIDEAEGRRVADREGVPYIGLLGVLLQAKQSNHVHSLRPLIDQLQIKAGE